MSSFQRKFNRAHKLNKMRALNFTTTDAETFELIYTGLMVTPKELDRKGHRLHTKITDKLEDVSCFKDDDKDSRILNPNGGIVILEEAEFTLLKECLEAVKFLPRVSKKVNTLWDFLDASKEESLKKVD